MLAEGHLLPIPGRGRAEDQHRVPQPSADPGCGRGPRHDPGAQCVRRLSGASALYQTGSYSTSDPAPC